MPRVVVLVLCAVVLAGCPGRGKRSTLPKHGDRAAKTRFLGAQAAFLRDGGGLDDFVAIAEDYPDDPIVPWANLYAGIAQTTGRDFPAAERSLLEVANAEGADKWLRKKSRMWLGIAQNYQGRHADAVRNLAGTKDVIEDDRERGEWIAAMAIASAGTDEPLSSLRYFDQWYEIATPAERGFILARLAELAISASPEAARAAFDDLGGRGPAAAVLGYRVAADREATGELDKARRIRESVMPVRRALGLPLAATAGAAPGGGDPGLVGAILPQTGRSARVGELAAQGLAVAAGAAGGGEPGAITVDLRAATTAIEAEAAVDQLVASGAIAIIGPIDAEAVDAAAVRVDAMKIPMLSLSAAPEQRLTGRWVFHVMHPAPQRARLLARAAAAGDVKTFAVLYPDSGYGRAVRDAFIAELVTLGGTVVTEAMYPTTTTSFSKITKDLGKGWQGVFVADNADTLALIAPALAANDLVPRPMGTKRLARGESGRPILLVSTAENLLPDYQAARHSRGALLAPGFYPDDKDPAMADFVRSYTAGVGKPPRAVDAYAYDAASAVAATGASGRADLVGRLDRLDRTGVTGTMRFDERHLRADDGIVFTVVTAGADGAPTYEIRARR